MIWHINSNRSYSAPDGEIHDTICGIKSFACITSGGAEVMISVKNSKLCRVCRGLFLTSIKTEDRADIDKLIGGL